MKSDPDHGINDPDVRSEEPGETLCVQGLLAGTLAVMTAHAEASHMQDRLSLAIKTASNLFMLAQHPAMAPGFRAVAWRLRSEWVERIQTGHCTCNNRASGAEGGTVEALPGDMARALWHRTAEEIQ